MSPSSEPVVATVAEIEARGRWWWFALAALALAQLVALWLVCSHQVRRAEARQTEVQVHQMALADCLQFIPGSTIASCTSQLAGTPQADATARGAPPVTGALPVSFSYR